MSKDVIYRKFNNNNNNDTVTCECMCIYILIVINLGHYDIKFP
jgi:hypothetical protein